VPFTAPIEAATVVLVRERGEAIETFLVRRHRASGFMAGAFVFPGGKLDPADESEILLQSVPERERARLTKRLEPTPNRVMSAERAVGLAIATLRELYEEAGVLLARRRGEREILAGVEVQAWRRELLGATLGFAALVQREGLELALDHLEYWDHWITPSAEPRRFDTRFFIARLPTGQIPEIDDKETTEARWLAPEAALALHRAEELFLPPPTERTLEGLVGISSFEDLVREAAGRVVAPILPKLLLEDSSATIIMPWDSDYSGIPGEGLSIDADRVTAAQLGSRIPVGAGFLKRV
jgi:8-oxo-dGTP pyrophosphatase MutT (NUDIX family)